MQGEWVVPRQPRGDELGLGRRLSLAITAGLHGVLAAVTGVALAGHPRAGGIPVLRGSGTEADCRYRLEAALDALHRTAPELRRRLQRHVTGLFLSRQPHAHGYYSRITGTCTLDVGLLTRESAAETAGAMVRCATEGWLWRSGRGRTCNDEARILVVSERARRHFLRRADDRLGASR